MKGLLGLVSFVLLPTAIALLKVIHARISDTAVPRNDNATSVSEADRPDSASASITITMHGVADNDVVSWIKEVSYG